MSDPNETEFQCQLLILLLLDSVIMQIQKYQDACTDHRGLPDMAPDDDTNSI